MQCMAENETAVPDEASTPVVVPMDTCRADMPTVQNMGRQESTVSSDVVQVEATYAGMCMHTHWFCEILFFRSSASLHLLVFG